MKRLITLLTVLAMAATPLLAGTGGSLDIPGAFGSMSLIALGAYIAVPVALRAFGIRLSILGFLATAIDTTALNAAYDAQYKDGSKSLKDLRGQLFESSEFDKCFTIEYTQLTTWEKGVTELSSMLQRYQKAFTPNGTLTLTPSKYDLHDVKIEGEWTPKDIKNGFAGFLEKTGLPPNAQALTKYMVTLLEKKFPEDLELYAAWGGVQGAVTPGTAGDPEDSMDGFRKTINDGISASTIVPIVVGAAPTDPEDYVEYIEEWAAGIDNKAKKIPMKLALNVVAEERFKEGMRLKYNTHYKDADVTRVYTRPNLTVVGQVAMGDSEKIWASPMDNLYKVVNLGDSRQLNLQWQTDIRAYQTWADIGMRYCIWMHSLFFTNDVDTGAGS